MLVLAVAAALALAFPSGGAMRASRPRTAPPPAIDLRLLPPEKPRNQRDEASSDRSKIRLSDLFSPTLFAFGPGNALPTNNCPIEDEAAAAARAVPPPPGRAASADTPLPVPFPESALAARLGPAPPLFSGPRPPRAAAPESAPQRPAATATLFYDPGAALPTVVVDAPGFAPSEIPALEAAVLSRILPPAPTSRVIRVRVP